MPRRAGAASRARDELLHDAGNFQHRVAEIPQVRRARFLAAGATGAFFKLLAAHEPGAGLALQRRE